MEKPILTDITQYLLHPREITDKTPTRTPQKILNTIRILGLQLGIALTLGVIATYVTSLFDYNATEQNTITQLTDKGNILFIIMLTVIYAPIVEEITFRLFLKFSPVRLGLGISFLIFFSLQILDSLGISILQQISDMYFLNYEFIFLVICLELTLFAGIILSLLIIWSKAEEKIKKIYTKTFGLIFYFAVIFFGLSHVFNYVDFQKIWFVAPILASPQIIIGLFLGYIRGKYGFSYSVLLHALHNLVSSIPLLLLALLSNELLDFYSSESLVASEELITSLPMTDYFLLFLIMFYLLFGLFFIVASVISLLVDLFKQSKS